MSINDYSIFNENLYNVWIIINYLSFYILYVEPYSFLKLNNSGSVSIYQKEIKLFNYFAQ